MGRAARRTGLDRDGLPRRRARLRGPARRAGYGVSPGDADHPEPYLYVGPWGDPPAGPDWTATGFRGAELGYAELLAEPDQRAAALAFFRARRADLLDGPARA